MKTSLKNKCVIVFGATGKIGTKLTIKLAKENVKLIVQGKSKEKLEKLDNKLKSIGKSATLIHLDVSNIQNYRNIGEVIYKRFKKIDFYFNAISEINKLTPITHLNNEEWNRILEVNLNSKWRLLKQIEVLLGKSNNPAIYFFLHKSAIKNMAYYHGYSIANSALKKLVEVYHEEKKRFNFYIKGVCEEGILGLNDDDEDKKFCQLNTIIKEII